MNIIQAIILGVLQGIAEFLPISSSGHLVVFRDVLGLGISRCSSISSSILPP
jgi:undecaprenyl-diphosphatase